MSVEGINESVVESIEDVKSIQKNETLSDKISWLYKLTRFGCKPGLDTISKLCELFDNPQDSFKSVHVAGTNGKGSCCAIMYSILKNANYNVGLYTSPHLAKFNERIKFIKDGDEREIFDTELGKYVDIIRAKVDEYNLYKQEENMLQPTFFEFTTLLMFLFFKDLGLDYVVIETGMGGRLDATNVIIPEVSIITSISLDHVDHLGNDELSILKEKLGIVKRKGMLICALEKPELIDFAKKYCEEKEAVFKLLNQDFFISDIICYKEGQEFDYSGLLQIDSLFLPLIGLHQVNNAALAINALDTILPNLEEDPVINGLKDVNWKGRFEIISKKPLIIIDSAHNLDGFTRCMETLDKFSFSELVCIVGFSQTKDITGMLSLLRRRTENIVITKSDYNPLDLRALESTAEVLGFNILGKYDNPMDAYEFTKTQVLEEDCLLVTGSIYMIGKLYE
jgi:dihydrofolate synthase/folylpolyglutamate synthase